MGNSRKRDSCATISVPEAGKRFFGLSPNGSYAAAGRGEIIAVPVGRLLRVPVKLMERKLGIEADFVPKAADEADQQMGAQIKASACSSRQTLANSRELRSEVSAVMRAKSGRARSNDSRS